MLSLPEQWLFVLCVFQCHRNAGAKAFCFSLHFLNLSLTVHCGGRALNYLIAQPQVSLGGNSVSIQLPSLWGELDRCGCLASL